MCCTLLCTLLGVFVAAAISTEPALAAVSDWQKGITLRLQNQPQADVLQSLKRIKETGANFISITPGHLTNSKTSSNVDRKPTTPSDELLIYTVQEAHNLGLKVMIKPHLDIEGGSWRANLDPSDKVTFFQNYSNMILHYADIAAATNAEQLSVGAELYKLSTNPHNESYWRDLIAKIRPRYNGSLTYSANANSQYYDEGSLPFWNALDYWGVSAYFKMADNSNPTVDSIKAEWQKIANDYLIPMSQKIKLPLIFAEVGYRSIDGAAMAPENYSLSASLDLQEQADLYQALIEYWQDKDYFHGVHFWDWWPREFAGGPNDGDYTPQGKPAENILSRYFNTSSNGSSTDNTSSPVTAASEIMASGLNQPVVLTSLPDGRIFIGEKASGKVKIFKNNSFLTQPLLDIKDFIPASAYFDTFSERGLLGIAFHPDFLTDPTRNFVYLYYTICKSPNPGGIPGTSGGCNSGGAKNRVSRFRVNGDMVDSTSGEQVILDNIDSPLGYHNAGWIGFSPDKKLYVAAGDGGGSANRINSQKTTNLNGKILRVNDDGSVPADNPWSTEMQYVSLTINPSSTSKRREIWAMGLRNPWRCRFDEQGKLFCADVGEKSQEEINRVERGGNYGWPYAEGTICPSGLGPDTSCPSSLNYPIATYPRSLGASIIGGDFGSRTNFPNEYRSSYFFADYVGGWIKRIELNSSGIASDTIQNVISDLGSIVDLIAGPDGNLYYLNIADGTLGKIFFESVVPSNRGPTVKVSANSTSGSAPLLVQFSSDGTFDPDGDALDLQWNFGDGVTSSALNPEHLYEFPGSYGVNLTVSDGKEDPGPRSAGLSVLVGSPPQVTIISPLDNATFEWGNIINLEGSALDPDSGSLPSSNLHWKIIFHHDTHIHPFINDLVGSPQSFSATTTESGNLWYEIFLSASDETGLTTSASVRINPISPPPSPPPPPPATGPQIVVFSPQPSSTVSGEKKLKIYIPNRHPSTYVAKYNVDNRGEVLMTDAPPYKQAKIQFDSWTWNGRGPYRVLVTAYEKDGRVIDTETLTLYIKQ